MKRRIWISLALGLCLLLASASLVAADPAPKKETKKNTVTVKQPLPKLNTVLGGLQKRYQKVKSLETPFTQTYASRLTKQTTVSKGKLYFSKPGSIRWDYSTAPKRTFVYDGTWFHYAEYEKKTVARTKVLMHKDLVVALVFLTGQGAVTDHFEPRVIKPEEFEPDIPTAGRIILELMPKEESETFAVMYLLLDHMTYNVTEVILYDLVGNRNRIAFTDPVYDKPLKPNMFTFTAPANWTKEEW